MIHKVEGNGVPYELCGIYEAEITSVTYKDEYFNVEMRTDSGHDVKKRFKLNDFFYHFIKSIGLNPLLDNKMSDMIGRMVWLAISIDEDKCERFIFNFYLHLGKESRPGVQGDPAKCEDGMPYGPFLRYSNNDKVIIH